MIRRIFLFSCLLLAVTLLFGQKRDSSRVFVQKDVFDLFRRHHTDSLKLKKKAVRSFKPYFTILPVIGSNPALGFVVGGSCNIAMYLGRIGQTPISSLSLVATYTTRQQIIFKIKSNIATQGSRYILRGDWRYLIYTQPTYGLGSQTPGAPTRDVHLSISGLPVVAKKGDQPMAFNYLRIYETAYFRLSDWLYYGIGYRLDWYSNIHDELLQVDSFPLVITDHFSYSIKYGVNPKQYMVSGISAELMTDTRDNTIRPTRGMLANVAFRINPGFLGSSKNSFSIYTEYRGYFRLSQRNPAHLIAIWYWGEFNPPGTVPYLALPAIGWDMYERSGRGYVQGRFRGVNMMYAEAEYRFPISRRSGILSGVLFLNAVTASGDDDNPRLLTSVEPGAGAGLRIMLNKKSLSNICIDFAFGNYNSRGLFLNLNETF